MVMVALCVLGLFSYAQLRRRAAARHRAADRLRRRRLPRRLARGGRDRADPADRAGAERHRRRQDDPLEQLRGAQRDGASSSQLNADMNRAVQDVRDKVAAVQPSFPRDAKPPYVARFDGDNAQPTVVISSLLGQDRSARELSLLADQVVGKRLERVERRRPGRRRRPDGAPGAHRPRPAAPARLPADAGRVVDRAAARQRRHAGRPAHRHQGGRDRARRGQGARRQGVRRRRRRDAATAWW